MFDIIIKNGVIIDGTGKPMEKGDIGIKEGKIAEIGDLHNEKSDQEIDAKNMYVSPGFIDVDNHSDTRWRIFSNPDLESLIYQGITTIIGGNCGSSLAPLHNSEMIKSIRKWFDINSININWATVKDFLTEVEKANLSVNFGTMVGHSTLRRGIIGDATRDLTEDELRVMEDMLKKSMREGAFGISTGLIYSHAKLAPKNEIERLNKVVAKFDGVYATHVRNESNEILSSLDEAIETAKNSNKKLHISHLKIMGEKNWSFMTKALEKIDQAKDAGIDISFDVFPYTATGSVLYTFLPEWVSKGGRKMMMARLKDKSLRDKIIKEMREDSIDYARIIVAIYSMGKTLTRRIIADIAQSQCKSPEETVIDLLIASGGRIITITDALDEENLEKAIQHPLSVISSNGSGYNIEHKSTGELVHPRDFGAFPKILASYVKRKRLLDWEQAINKMTAAPAQKFGIHKRGIIKKGNYADIIVFDPETINDMATINKPYQYPVGMEYVLVNGKVTLEKGVYNNVRNGQIILKKF
ncbi:MAG: D-aminoacylase [Candidatus Moranbacteria bacterium]|jgi:N-acyl-D-amino-acid deacylase|nr:D-aminoacylase [Candidatus Moranbacteria bacterium]